MGKQDEQRKGQFKPLMGLPASRAARQPDDPPPASDRAASVPPGRPTPGKRGGQFHGLPRLGARRDRSADDSPAQADAGVESDVGWDDRFAARHAPERSYDTPPRRRIASGSDGRNSNDSGRAGDGGRRYDDQRGYTDDTPSYDDRRGYTDDGRSSDDRRGNADGGRSNGPRGTDAWAADERARRDDAWDEEFEASAPKRDPWRRDWVQWTSTDLAVDDIMNYRGDEYGADDYGVRSRDAWGGEPDPYTMASVALEVELPRPGAASSKAHGSKNQAKVNGHLNRKGKEQAAIPQFINWAQHKFAKNAQPTQRAMRVLVVLCLLGVVLLTSLGTGLTGLADYLAVKGLATDALSSLNHLSYDLGLAKGAPQMTDAQRSAAARSDVEHALYDMQSLHDRIAHPDFILSLAGSVPQVAPKLQSGLALSDVGIVGMQMLLSLVPTLVSVSKVLTASPIATSSTTDNTPLLGADDLAQIASSIQQIQPQLATMISLIHNTPPNILVAALSAKQQGEILPLLQDAQYLPNALNIITQFLNLPDSTAATMLGITHGPVGYLLMTLDNAEIRPVGGFQGQFAVIGVNGGRVSHIALQDVYNYLEPLVSSGPSGQGFYVSDLGLPNEGWFPAVNPKTGQPELGWAMRNSGLSPEFTQSARYALWYLHNEELCQFKDPNQRAGVNGVFCTVCPNYFTGDGGIAQCYAGGDRLPIVNSKGVITGFEQKPIPMAGVIMIQSNIISQFLDITGPIKIGCPYNQEVSGGDLEYLIHYYQETPEGRKISARPCSTQVSDTTKRFTGLVTQALQAKIKVLPKTELLKFVGDIVQDLHNKDIQIYFTDPTRNQVGNGPSALDGGYDPATLYPPEVDAEGFLQHYQVSSELYEGGVDDILALNRADIAGWKLEPYVKIKLVDNIQLDNSGNATHNFQALYTFNIPPISIKNSDGSLMTTTQIQNAVYKTVYDASFGQQYQEFWRIYTNPNARSNGNGYPIQSDVPNLDEIGNYLYYRWQIDYNTGMIDWTSDYTMNPQRSWVVPNVVQANGKYILHVQPQSGVNTSAEVVITLPNGKTCQMLNGSLTQNVVLSVNATTGTC